MTLKEAADQLGVTPDNLRGAIARGSLKARKLGPDWIVTAKEVERYRAEHRRLPATGPGNRAGMTPYHADPWLTVYQGDCREVMRQMEPESVHCVVTSPPYWGLRDYGTASWVGGDEGCDHKAPEAWASDSGDLGERGGVLNANEAKALRRSGLDCRKCGATRIDSQLGLEATPEEFVANMVDVFREVKRVLRSDGTCWVNLGDSYAGGNQGGTYNAETWKETDSSGGNSTWTKRQQRTTLDMKAAGLKPKDLVGIPWRVAFALQADGWYLRSDIIWAKPNPMPESVTDRPTKSHEYLFLLTKSARYYYDADAVREPHEGPHSKHIQKHHAPVKDRGEQFQYGKQGLHDFLNPAGRNLRTVWTIATAPYPGAHFATFPPKLVEPCIKAGAPEKVCGECGAGWRRVTETTRGEAPEPAGYLADLHASTPSQTNGHGSRSAVRFPNSMALSERGGVQSRTLGFIPSCKHDAPTVPSVVLDPFAGSGTVGMVAQSLSRRAVLIDLNGDYLVQAMSRNQQSPLGLETA